MHSTSVVATCYHHLRPTKVNAQQDKLDRRWTTKLTILGMVDGQCLFQASFFWGGGILPPSKKIQFPLNTARLRALDLFFDRDTALQIHHGNFLLMDNKQTKNYQSFSNHKDKKYA